MKHLSSGTAVSWFCRKYQKVNGALQYAKGHEGDWRHITNPILWEDENIKKLDNWNVVTDGGRQLIPYNLFAIGASGFPMFMCFGSGSTPASHLDTRLTYELIADSTRPQITNENGSALSGSTVTLTNYTDDDYDPPYPYYVQAIVRADIDGDTSLNVGAPIREVGLNTNVNCPGSPTGTSGVLWNHYVYPSSTTLDAGTLFIAIGFLHF